MNVFKAISSNIKIFLALLIAVASVASLYAFSMDDVYEYNMVFETGQLVFLETTAEGGAVLKSKPLVRASELGELVRTFHKRSKEFQKIRILVPRDSEKYLTVVSQSQNINSAKRTLESLLAQLEQSFEAKLEEAKLQLSLHREKFKSELNNQKKGIQADQRPNYELAILADRSRFMISSLDQALNVPLLRNIKVFDGFATSESPIGPPRVMIVLIGLLGAFFISIGAVVVLEELAKD